MPKKNQIFYRDNVKVQSSLGLRILEGLTEAEISQLLDSLFAVFSDEQHQTAFVQPSFCVDFPIYTSYPNRQLILIFYFL
ncbi:hypothetical protein [Nostoc sp. NMS4]|uniref:hypothetical protein n=1 Tax=Nostoc sp. NMS4 TaxID=2815390 RepID=UPI0025F15CF7|nr:hypothetical protein [Nostoc sp. NMS4]